MNLVLEIIGEYCFGNPYWKSYETLFKSLVKMLFENLFGNVSGNMCRVRLWKIVSAAFAKPFSKIFSGSLARNHLEMLLETFVIYAW